MRVMVFVKATADSEAGPMPAAEMTAMLTAMGAYNEELARAGIMVTCDGLTPSSAARRIAFDGGGRTVIDGPFPVAEVVAGFWIWHVRDMDEAITWARRCPNPMPGPSQLEIRPIAEIDDLGAAMTPVLKERESRLRTILAEAGTQDQ